VGTRDHLIGCKVTTDYYENEVFKIVDVRVGEFLLRGDWSGGTHSVCQESWYPEEKCKFLLVEVEWLKIK